MGTLQLWGTGSGMTNVSSMIDAYLVYDEYKLQTYEDKKTSINTKKNSWNDLKTSVEKIDKIISDLSGTDKVNYKTVNLSSTSGLQISVGANAQNISYSMSVKQLASAHTVAGTKVASIKDSLNLSGSFSLNGTKITIEDGDSLSDLVKKINNTTDGEGNPIGARAYVVNGSLFVESTETGVDNTLEFEDTDGVLKNLGIIKEDGSVNTTKEPSNAIININGVDIERSSNKITDAIDDMEITLTGVTAAPVTATVEENKEDITKLAKDLVDSLNDLLSKISKYTSYNESGTSGVLNGDSSVSSIKSIVTQALQKPGNTGGEFNYLFDIGISVDRYGKFSLDEKKLENALSKNPGDTLNLLTGGLDKTTTKPGDSGAGILVNLKDAVNQLIGGTQNLFSSKASSFDSQIKTYEKMISKQESYIEARRTLLEKQFAAMESAMSSYNSQLSYFQNLNSNSSSS